MRKRLRLLGLLVGEARAADPLRSVLAPALLILAGIGAMLQPWWLKVGLDAAVGGSAVGVVQASLGFTVTLGGFLAFGALGSRTSRRLMENLALATGANIARLAAVVPTLRLTETPSDMKRLAALRERRQDFGGLINGTVNLAGLVGRVVVATALLLLVHPALILIAPATFAVAIHAFRTQERLAQIESGEAWRWSVLASLESLALSPASAKEVKAWDAEAFLAERHRQLGEEPATVRTARRTAAFAQATGGLALGILYGAAVSLVVLPGTTTSTPGDLLLVALLITRLNETAIQMIPYGTWMAQALVLPEHLEWLRTTYAAERSPAEETLTADPGRVVLDRVSFTYPGAMQPAVHEVSLSLQPGTVVALVGPNGAGKTTLVKLLMGLHAPDGGHIRVDEQVLGPGNRDRWRRMLSGAFQDATRPELTVGEAVGIGDLGQLSNRRAIDRALETAGARRVLGGLPDGMDTQLGTTFGGVDLSGGQWQIIALARALMREQPVMLLLDEPTAPLDAEAEERHYQRVIDAARSGRARRQITLIVTHRMAVTAVADTVVMLEDGCIREVGAHRDLIEAGGPYARFYALQAAGYRVHD